MAAPATVVADVDVGKANGPKVDDVEKKPPQIPDRPNQKFQGGGHQFGNRNRGGGRFSYDRNRQGGRPSHPSGPKRELMRVDLDSPNQEQIPRRQNNQGRDDVWQVRSGEDRFADRIATISGPTIELPPIDNKEKKFSGRCRMYIGNLTNDVTKEELEQLFAPYGETSEVFINAEKNFAFVRMDYRANAEKAKRELDGFARKGRALRVRFAPHSAAVRVKNLNQFVTNELLEWAFQVFGEIERAVVIADERGKSTGEGIVEFARKPAALQALRRCSDGCYFITSSLRPVIVEPYELVDELDGFPEKSLFKKNADFYKEREVGPRFATAGSFEADYGARWKQLAELFRTKEEALKQERKLEEEKLEAQMEYTKYEYETEMLRAQLRQREQDRERQKREWELKEKEAEEMRRQSEDQLRRQQEDLQMRMKREAEGRRKSAENPFLQTPPMAGLMDSQQDKPLSFEFDHDQRNKGPGALASAPKAFLDSFDGRLSRPLREEQPQQRPARWNPHDRRPPMTEDYPLKRRRF